MDPGMGIWRVDWLEFLNGPRLGNTDRVLVENFGRPPGWGNWMDFCSKIMKVNFLVKVMVICLCGLNEDIDWFNRQVQDW